MSKKESAIINEIDKARLKLSIEHYIKYFIGKRTSEINKDEALNAIALAVREFAMDKMYETMARYNKVNSKRIYYLSIEYLIGRSLENNLHNLGLFNILKSIKIDGMPDISLQEIFDAEYDPALGNGGLGRLAACYLDSMASLGIPGFGYGINYQFGLFKQKFENGYQIEQADSWLGEDSPWQFSRPDRTVEIPIYGEVENFKTATGQDSFIWMNTQKFYGVPYDFRLSAMTANRSTICGCSRPRPTTSWTSTFSTRAAIWKRLRKKSRPKPFPKCCIRPTRLNRARRCALFSSISLFPAPFRTLSAVSSKRATTLPKCRITSSAS